MSRLATCIDKGLDLVKPAQEAIPRDVATIGEVAATRDPTAGKSASRQSAFDAILDRLERDDDPIHEPRARLMHSFRAGLCVGGEALDQVQDNLDLERWFRVVNGQERRIHGDRHAGTRIVQEGATMVHAWDAHRAHPEPFCVEDLFAPRSARAPAGQRQASRRRKIMRKARSKTNRPQRLAELERQYQAISSHL